MEAKQLLKDPDIQPTDEVIENALGKAYTAYQDFVETITSGDFALDMQWRYYNDGKAWLCKVVNKKKTVLWLSIWEKYFKTSFFFTEKTRGGVDDLDIAKGIKEDFIRNKNTGKLIPLILDINKTGQLKDLFKIIEYKKSLK